MMSIIIILLITYNEDYNNVAKHNITNYRSLACFWHAFGMLSENVCH